MFHLNKQGSIVSLVLCAEATIIWNWMVCHKMTLQSIHTAVKNDIMTCSQQNRAITSQIVPNTEIYPPHFPSVGFPTFGFLFYFIFFFVTSQKAKGQFFYISGLGAIPSLLGIPWIHSIFCVPFYSINWQGPLQDQVSENTLYSHCSFLASTNLVHPPQTDHQRSAHSPSFGFQSLAQRPHVAHNIPRLQLMEQFLKLPYWAFFEKLSQYFRIYASHLFEHYILISGNTFPPGLMGRAICPQPLLRTSAIYWLRATG